MAQIQKQIKIGLKHLAKADPSLRKLINKHSLQEFKPKMERSPYESLSRAIAHQQLHGKAAETILGRLMAQFPNKQFPLPSDIIKMPVSELRACGFSQSKVKSLKDIAQKTLDGIVPDSKTIQKMPDEDIIDHLVQIFGVGKWTVEMLLIFQLGRLDIWPVDDFGVRNGYRYFKNKRKMPTPKALKKIDKKWRPYRTLVALLLWREADLQKMKSLKA